MNVKIENPTDQLTRVHLSGMLDAASASQFDDIFSKILDSAKGELILDFAELEYVSSNGIRQLLLLAKNLTAKGISFSVVNVNPAVTEIFSITGLIDILNVK